jgi:hypothetical protein
VLGQKPTTWLYLLNKKTITHHLFVICTFLGNLSSLAATDSHTNFRHENSSVVTGRWQGQPPNFYESIKDNDFLLINYFWGLGV